jgi:hypothetical protein
MTKNKDYVLLGIAILSFSVVLISVFLLLFLFDDPETVSRNPFFTSEYIAQKSNELDSGIISEEIPEGKGINPMKQGDIVESENRKVITLEKELTQEQKEELEEKYNVEFTNESTVNGVYTIITSEDSDLKNFVNEETVKSVETDIPVRISSDTIDWGVSRIGADKVWGFTAGQQVTVAIVDTGIETSHPDLSGSVVRGYDFVNDKESAEDDHGHGTHVAGIIAAKQNQTGIVGTSHQSWVMPIKVLNSTGSGYVSDVAKGIYWAVDNGANIINLSLGAPVDTDVLRKAVNYASSKGVLMVGAAGNDSGSPCQYPAAYSSVICVVATDKSNKLASFSNIGGEIAAPGVSNYSTFLGGTYRYLSGTSMAAPHVSGSLALLKRVCQTCTPSELRTTLRETAVDLGEEGYDIIFGYGLVDLVSAVETYLLEEEVVEEIVPETTEETKEEPINEAPTIQPRGRKTEQQRPVITKPEKDRNDRFVMTKIEDVEIEFKLDPNTESDYYEKSVIYLNNEPVYTTTKRSDSYILKYDNFDGVQQFVRVTSFFSECEQPQVHDQIIIDRVNIIRPAPAKNIIQRGRRVLGISSTKFSIGDIFNFWW